MLLLFAAPVRAAGTWYEEVGQEAAPLRQAQGRPWSARYGHTSLVFNARLWVLGGDDGA